VLVIPTVEGNTVMNTTTPAQMAKLKFTIGAKVALKWRITWKFGPDSEARDVNAGTSTYILGYNATGTKPIVTFEAAIGKVIYETTREIKPECLCCFEDLPDADASGDEASEGGGKAKSAPGFKYVKSTEGEDMEIIKDWPTMESLTHVSGLAHRVKVMASFSLYLAGLASPTYTAKDLTVVRRGSQYEVYTNREFEKFEIVLVPDTTEIADRHWVCNGITVLANNGATHHPEKRNVALSGRLRNSPIPSRPFALFWLVYGAAEFNKEKASQQTVAHTLALEYAATEYTAKVKFPHTNQFTHHADAATAIQIPIMINNTTLHKGVLLTCAPDVNLIKARGCISLEPILFYDTPPSLSLPGSRSFVTVNSSTPNPTSSTPNPSSSTPIQISSTPNHTSSTPNPTSSAPRAQQPSVLPNPISSTQLQVRPSPTSSTPSPESSRKYPESNFKYT
jgi:hypothetical protein